LSTSLDLRSGRREHKSRLRQPKSSQFCRSRITAFVQQFDRICLGSDMPGAEFSPVHWFC
jgi:hypothetical protein